MLRNHVPGLSIAVIRSKSLAWSKGFGWADLEKRIPMAPDTLQNVGSVSKPIATTLVMQCVERGEFALDDDINDYLPFAVRNPNHPDAPITFAQLLTHRSSIADGSSYGYGYACGASSISLENWIRGYFLPGGAYNNADENFHAWGPGDKYEYNNVAFALLAYLVQVISGKPFEQYSRDELFGPLGMKNTSWFVANIDKSLHATPYAYVSNGVIDSPSWGGVALGLVNGEIPPDGFEGSYPDCIYDNPNFADGFLRSSVVELAHYQIMLLRGGELDGNRVLSDDSVLRMLGNNGIGWHKRELPGGPTVWGHGGGDPGISTLFDFQPTTGNGVVIFANTHGASLDQISARLFSIMEDFFD